ncbi:hypothetical protein VDTJJZMW_CDS_0144 [Pseudomonas phage LPS-5]|nr:hypothetical protein 9081_00154 [Pseudomonas phage bmx-p3]
MRLLYGWENNDVVWPYVRVYPVRELWFYFRAT